MNTAHNIMLVALGRTDPEQTERTLIDGNCEVAKVRAAEAPTAQMDSAAEVVVVLMGPEASARELSELVSGLSKESWPPPVLFVGDATDLSGITDHASFVEQLPDGDPARLLDALERGLRFRALQLGYRDFQERLIRADGLVTLGSLLAGLAHEIKTPLGAIRGNNEVLESVAERVRMRLEVFGAEHPDYQSECEETCEVFDESVGMNKMAIDRLLEIVKGVRNNARADDRWEAMDINDGIESSLTLLAHELKGRIEVIRELADLPEFEGCRGEISQVILNLLLNASQAIEGRGTIRVRTWEEDSSVRVAISDDGPGISDDVQKRMFDAGFTTKSCDVGSGWGLSISQRIVQRHGGTLEVESLPGSGTTFTLSLPRTSKSE